MQTTPIPAGHAERDAPNLKSHRTPHRSDSGKNFLVWSNSSRSQVVETFANCIEILLLDRHDRHAQLVCDGAVLAEITPGDRLSVKQAQERVTLLHPVDHDYYRLLRSKLHWGHGSHDHSR